MGKEVLLVHASIKKTRETLSEIKEAVLNNTDALEGVGNDISLLEKILPSSNFEVTRKLVDEWNFAKDTLAREKLKIDQSVISLEKGNLIKLVKEPLEPTLVGHIDPSRLTTFIENAILPIIVSNEIKIVN